MKAYKFLDANDNSPFAGFHWVPGVWVEAALSSPCHAGIHGCLSRDLSYWLSASLWEVELEGQIVESHRKVTGSRGRLVRRIGDYDAAVAELAQIGVWRSRDRAVEALESEGAGADAPPRWGRVGRRGGSWSGLGLRRHVRRVAGELAGARSIDDLAKIRVRPHADAFGLVAAALTVDAAKASLTGEPAESPFVAAYSAGHAAAGVAENQARFDEGFGTERAFQSAWLGDRLQLDV